MIKYDRFFKYLKQHDLSEGQAQKIYGIPRSLIQRMRHNENMSTSTIDKLCNSLGCSVSDICEYIPDGKCFPEKKKNGQ